jgi:hypothetical protein
MRKGVPRGDVEIVESRSWNLKPRAYPCNCGLGTESHRNSPRAIGDGIHAHYVADTFLARKARRVRGRQEGQKQGHPRVVMVPRSHEAEALASDIQSGCTLGVVEYSNMNWATNLQASLVSPFFVSFAPTRATFQEGTREDFFKH